MMDRVEGSIGLLGEKVGSDLRGIREEAQTFGGIRAPAKAAEATSATCIGGTTRMDDDDSSSRFLAEAGIESSPVELIGSSSLDHTPGQVGTVIAQTLDKLHLSSLLDKVAPVSHDRDVVFSATIGALLGVGMTALGMWMGR